MRFSRLALACAASSLPLILAACGQPEDAAPEAEVDAHTGAPVEIAQAAAGDLADGEAVWNTLCTACHDTPPDATTPPRAVLAGLDPDEIVGALRHGVMRLQGSTLTEAQHVAVAEYLTGQEVSGPPVIAQSAMCPADMQTAAILGDPQSSWNGWGGDVSNARYAPEGGLTSEDVPNLQLKWAFGIEGATQMRSQPAMLGGRLFFGSQSGVVYSIDAQTGCVHWAFPAAAGVRTAISAGAVDVEGSSGAAVYFTDATATAYALDAETGAPLWSRKLDAHPSATGTGAPTLFDGVLYAPVTGVSEESTASDPNYPCCTFRGSIVALNASTGEVIWKTYMMDEAQPRGTSAEGAPLWGPAGVGIWSAPTIDVARGLLYAATGNAYADPEPGTSDSIVALNLADGSFAWTTQLLPDVWIMGCSAPPPGAPAFGGGGLAPEDNANCPDLVGPDFDFSASPALATMADGRQIIAATQKSGLAYGLDPANDGELLWTFRWGRGSGIGGVWGTAADGEKAYFAVADVGSDQAGGVHAVDILTGEGQWFAPPQAPLCAPGAGCGAVQSAALTAIPGAVFSGGADGGMRAYDAQTGAIIWTFDANRSFDTVNGVAATGGSFDGPGPIVANGMVFMTSGNGGFVGRPGNVLLAFEVVD